MKTLKVYSCLTLRVSFSSSFLLVFSFCVPRKMLWLVVAGLAVLCSRSVFLYAQALSYNFMFRRLLSQLNLGYDLQLYLHQHYEFNIHSPCAFASSTLNSPMFFVRSIISYPLQALPTFISLLSTFLPLL